MLQQTQAGRVAEIMPRFLEAFPTIHDLASASNGEVLRIWQGMGYNGRALRLRDSAKAIVEQHNGVIPADPTKLRALPGIGAYTSTAVACFAYNKRVVVLDVNVRRVYTRLLGAITTADIDGDEELAAFAESLIPQRKPSLWHHAVMDLGATICTARKPKCDACPLESSCPSAHILLSDSKPKKDGPLFRGLPRRIWRGKTVEQLRHISSTGTTLSNLERAVFGEVLQNDDRMWFEALLDKLLRDGMISRKGQRISLAD
jgi:A/G-specific adenine glycosylase